MTYGLIWAQSINGVIGRDGVMPWHLPEDLTHFKEVTRDARVVMGRRTWESLPERFRPLPGRENVVVTSSRDWTSPGAVVAHDLAAALDCPKGVWVIGGATIYAQTIDGAERLVVTEINERFDGDACAPKIDAGWKPTAESDPTWLRARNGMEYRFVTYTRA